ncbi:MAG: cell division protein FtsZ [Hyphomicrobium sp.]
MAMKFQLPKLVEIAPRLTVVGIGGAGCNAVNNMIAAGLQGVDFVVANTDAQSLAASSAETRIQLGANLTEGLGAGSKPEIGEAAAEEAIEEIRAHIAGSHMVFIAAGMGGGTGTGAAAVVARSAREMGILTVGIVTKPFQFEGARRMRIAESGVRMLRQHVDTLIVIPNQNLFRVANERTTFAEAFVLADQVLYSGVACVVDLVLKEGLINLDFADVKTVMTGMGTAMMGTGEASGERRAILAAEEAIANPLLDDVSLKGARGLLLSITGGQDLTLYEVDEAASRVREEVDPECNIIVGATFDDNLGDRVRVSIVASGMGRLAEAQGTQPLAPAGGLGDPRNGHQPQAAAPSTQGGGFIPAQRPSVPAQSPTTAHSHPQTQFHPGVAEDMQRRLAEALQPSAGGHATGSNGYGQSRVAPSAASAAAVPSYQQPSHYEPTPAPRESWRAPGNVMIEDGLAPFASHAARPDASAQLSAPAGYAVPPRGFEPAAPADIRRAPRRMPDVAEFPPVAQREWQARQGAPALPAATTTPVHQTPKKPGILGRIAGIGRKADDVAVAKPSAGSEQRTPDDEPPLPVFFGRERR